MKKRPREVFSAMTRDKVFSVTPYFVPVEAEADISPYRIYQPGKSRVVLSIVNTTDKTYPTGNIRIDELESVFENTRSAHQIDMFAKMPVIHQMFSGIKETQRMIQGVQEGIRIVFNFLNGKKPVEKAPVSKELDNSLAKTVMIANGKLKGRTPFQVLSESGKAGMIDLQTQYDWLKKNLPNFPENKLQMDAISNAVDLFKSGKINLGDNASGDALSFGTIPIYKATPRALIREEDKNGFAPVYEVSINWHVADSYPVEIRIKRYKAPIVRTEDGRINPQRSEAIDIEDDHFRLTSGQWLDCVRLLKANMTRFEMLLANRQFTEVEEADAYNRGQSKK